MGWFNITGVFRGYWSSLLQFRFVAAFSFALLHGTMVPWVTMIISNKYSITNILETLTFVVWTNVCGYETKYTQMFTYVEHIDLVCISTVSTHLDVIWQNGFLSKFSIPTGDALQHAVSLS